MARKKRQIITSSSNFDAIFFSVADYLIKAPVILSYQLLTFLSASFIRSPSIAQIERIHFRDTKTVALLIVYDIWARAFTLQNARKKKMFKSHFLPGVKVYCLWDEECQVQLSRHKSDWACVLIKGKVVTRIWKIQGFRNFHSRNSQTCQQIIWSRAKANKRKKKNS